MVKREKNKRKEEEERTLYLHQEAFECP
jgi:hypothetical protein